MSARDTETEARGSACADARGVSQHADRAPFGGLSCTPRLVLPRKLVAGRGLPGVQQHRSLDWGAPGSLQASSCSGPPAPRFLARRASWRAGASCPLCGWALGPGPLQAEC